MGSKRQLSCFVTFSLCLLLAGCAGVGEMGKSGDAADQNVLGTTGNSIRGTVVSVPEPAEQLTSGLAENGNGNFHPDGSRIIFQSNRDGKWQIYELNLTDMSELRLHESDFIEENPVWTSDGNSILFVSSPEGDDEWNRDIMMFTPELTDLKSVTNSPGDDWYPVIMNQDYFVFLSERDSNVDLPVHVRANSVYLANLNGGTPTFLSGTSDDFKAPTVINDENILVLNKDDQIVLYDLTTRISQAVSPAEIVCGSSDFSNEKSWIVFTGSNETGDLLYILDTKEGVYQEINTGFVNLNNPRFSPDSKWLLFGAEVDGHFQLFRLSIASL